MKSKNEMWIDYRRKPDRLELIVRSVCGALLGLVLALYFGLQLFSRASMLTWVSFSAALVIVCAWGAAKYGDEFWCKFKGFF